MTRMRYTTSAGTRIASDDSDDVNDAEGGAV